MDEGSIVKQNRIKNILSHFMRPGAPLRHCLFVLIFYSLLFTIFFSPVIFHDSLLAPGGGRLGDAVVSHIPYYLSEKLSWDPLLSCGFPMIADSQAMSWYPPALLLSLLPGTWNLFVISAYVMAACFAYGYVYALTESRMAALVAGTTYSMCGFMFAHLGHTAMIHSAVWLPLIVWSIEMLRRELSRFWLALGCVAVACCVFAGHLQIVVYSLIVSCAYAVVMGWSAPAERARFYLHSALMLTLGLGLAAIQILPTAELASFSTRADFTFADFVSYSLPFKQIPMLIFPAAFGGIIHYGTTPYFGDWNLIEMTGYVGLLPPVLAALGLFASRRKAVSIFWLSVGVLAFILALGERTPLASLIYQLPVLSRFRVPARHFIEMALAASVLAGIGVRAILSGKVTRRLVITIICAAALAVTVGLLVLLSNRLSQYALAQGVAQLNMLPWRNLAVGVPLLIFLIEAAVLLYWLRAPASLHRRALVFSILIIDLSSFGWFFNWRDSSPRKEILNPPAAALKYRDLLEQSRERMLSVRGTMGTVDELPPNLSRIWGVPNATGYGPLIPSRVLYFLSILPDASVASTWKNAEDQSLNLTSVRYVFLPRSGVVRDERGISWSEENMDLWLGAGCDHPPRNSVRFNLDAPFRTTRINLVTRLACSVPLTDGEEVARVLLTDVDGGVQTASLRAGLDSSEWSYDCPSIKQQIKHQRAEVFSSFPAKMYDEPCVGHFYFTSLKLSGGSAIKSVLIQKAGSSGAITIEKISLTDDANNSEAISPLSIEGSPWRFIEEAGEARIYENPRASPRAWLVPEALTLSPEQILSSIKTSRLPDGREFDPMRFVLLEEPLASVSHERDPSASARITQFSNTSMEVQITSSLPSYLVTSDVYYPGWQATLDGAPVQLLRADYILRAVQIPAGSHSVRFEFRLKSFYRGAAITALSFLALAVLLAISSFFPKFAKS